MRLRQQSALLASAQVVTNELRPGTILQLLVDQVSSLLEVDAADCYLFASDARMLRCAAVHGLDQSLVGYEFPAGEGLAAAIAGTAAVACLRWISTPFRPVRRLRRRDGRSHGLAGETRGVIGIGTRDRRRTFTDADAMC